MNDARILVVAIPLVTWLSSCAKEVQPMALLEIENKTTLQLERVEISYLTPLFGVGFLPPGVSASYLDTPIRFPCHGLIRFRNEADNHDYEIPLPLAPEIDSDFGLHDRDKITFSIVSTDKVVISVSRGSNRPAQK